MGVFSLFIISGLYRLYDILATKYLLAKIKNELQQELIDARQKLLDETIQKLEDYANEED